MIVLEGTLWPVVFLGAVDETSSARPETGVVDERMLAATPSLAIGVVVAGRDEQATRAHEAAIAWLRAHQTLVSSRARRVAWVIEDDRVYRSTREWIQANGGTFFGVPSQTFRAVHPAVSWLVERPRPLSGLQVR